MKTSELIGPALDWAVAKCEGKEKNFGKFSSDGKRRCYVAYSADWSQGGPIIEREKILLNYDPEQGWVADDYAGNVCSGMYWGDTILIAAMRAYVASKLGDEVEIPEELK